MIDGAAWIVVLLQIFFVDLLLGADNAVVIGLACARLPAEETRRAMMLGVAGAIALRLGMIAFANLLLDAPLVKLVGAWMLVVIALNVRARGADDDAHAAAGGGGAGDFLTAAAVIMLTDAAMSLDNVVAVAAIAGGNFWLLALGILLSIPIIGYGSLILVEIVRRAPAVMTLGSVVLGWIAGEMAVSDPLLSGWMQSNAPALSVFAPALTAAFVWVAGQGAERRSPRRATAPAARTAIPRPAIAPLRPLAAAPPPIGAGVQLSARNDEREPAFASEPPLAATPRGWSEERAVVVGFVILAALAGIIIFVASFLDSLT